ncbi:hypothetical protein HD554DRAFT_2042388 [Boletus coccyginus]|nr:hypothetical protein HD554DRAFT_2042388 [Boletus coccyginus]
MGCGFPETTGNHDLHPIVEHNEVTALYNPNYFNVDISLDRCHGGIDSAKVLSVITGGDTLEFNIEPEGDGYEMRSQEDFDLDDVTIESDKNGSASDLDPDLVFNVSTPAKWVPPIKPIGKGKVPVKPTSLYDPATYVFKISCAVHRTQDSKLSNILFYVSFYITLNELCITIAEKLDWFPGLIKLQY